MGSVKYTPDELKRMRTIMLTDPLFGSPEYDSVEKPTLEIAKTQIYEAVKLPQVDVETAFTGSLSFDKTPEQKVENISLIKEEMLAVVEEKVEIIEDIVPENTDKEIQKAAFGEFITKIPSASLAGKALDATEKFGKATEATFGAALDLFKMIVGKEKPKKDKEKDPKKAQEEILIMRQNVQTVEQAAKDAKVISESRAQKDFQRIAGDEVAVMNDEAKKKILNLQTGLEKKFTAKDAADLRNALMEQKKQQEQQKTAASIRSAKGPNLNKNLANEQGVHSIYNTAG